MIVWNLLSSHFIVTIVYNESWKQHIFLPSPESSDVWEYFGAPTPYSEKPSVVLIVLTMKSMPKTIYSNSILSDEYCLKITQFLTLFCACQVKPPTRSNATLFEGGGERGRSLRLFRVVVEKWWNAFKVYCCTIISNINTEII